MAASTPTALESTLAGSSVERRDGVYYLTDPAPYAERELRYWRVRAREVRLYTDEVVRRLPHVPPEHPLAAEWAARADSLGRLKDHVARLQRNLTILDLGCGNGWMASHLAALSSGMRVWGLDLNRRELAQGARVFVDQPRLRFVYGDVFSDSLPAAVFDLIVVASAIQYFSDLPALVRRLLTLVRSGGEVHLLDSPLYAAGEVRAARERTRDYYAARGLLPAVEDYHHHTFDSLAPFNAERLYDPHAWPQRLARLVRGGAARSPFAWLRIIRR